MISFHSVLIASLFVLTLGMIYYYSFKISTLERNINEMADKIKTFEYNISKKDPYEDYRNDKGLLSMKHVKERYHGKP